MNQNDILNKINNNGYEAYLVGGYPRDKYLNKETYDIDIATNANIDTLINLFPNYDSYNKYGIKIKNNPYTYEITPYRKESNYQDHRTFDITFINSKEEDSLRRDFTINAIYIDKDNNIYDPFNGIEDIKKKTIRCIGNINDKMTEDPLRILRCIRFSTTLDFNIEDELLTFIKNNPSLINNISQTRILEELTKILKNPNCHKGLNILKQYNYLNYMSINYDKITYVDDLYAMYSQIDFIEQYPFSKEDKIKILSIKEILKQNKIDKLTIFKYGLELSLTAGKILNIDSHTINNLYENLPIKNINELDITSTEIHNLLNISSKKINYLLDDIVSLILNNKLNNNKQDIINYIKE